MYESVICMNFYDDVGFSLAFREMGDLGARKNYNLYEHSVLRYTQMNHFTIYYLQWGCETTAERKGGKPVGHLKPKFMKRFFLVGIIYVFIASTAPTGL